MTIDDYRRRAASDRNMLDRCGNLRDPASKTSLGSSMAAIADRYYEAIAAIMFFDKHGHLPKWAETS